MSHTGRDLLAMKAKVAQWPQSAIAGYYRRILRIRAGELLSGAYNA